MDANAPGGTYGNAMQAASCNGHDGIIRLLLEHGADLSARGGAYGNALQAASIKGHHTVVRLLLERGADANAKGGWPGSALKAATLSSYKQIAQLLLENGAIDGSSDEKYRDDIEPKAGENEEPDDEVNGSAEADGEENSTDDGSEEYWVSAEEYLDDITED